MYKKKDVNSVFWLNSIKLITPILNSRQTFNQMKKWIENSFVNERIYKFVIVLLMGLKRDRKYQNNNKLVHYFTGI